MTQTLLGNAEITAFAPTAQIVAVRNQASSHDCMHSPIDGQEARACRCTDATGNRDCAPHGGIQSHCDGCDQAQFGVDVFRVKIRGAGNWEYVKYCPDCAALARVDFSGTIECIVPVAVTGNSTTR